MLPFNAKTAMARCDELIRAAIDQFIQAGASQSCVLGMTAAYRGRGWPGTATWNGFALALRAFVGGLGERLLTYPADPGTKAYATLGKPRQSRT